MQGHIRKRGKDSWTVVLDMGRDPTTGKRRQVWRSVKGTKREAQALLVQLLHQRDIGIDLPLGKVTVAEYLARWLQDYAEPNVAPRTWERYEQIIRVHLVPALGSLPLGKLRPSHIQTAYRAIRDKGLSPRTVLHCHRVLREALHRAVLWQMLAMNPADSVEAPRAPRPEMRALAPDALQGLLAASKDSGIRAVVFTAVATGLRLGELLALRWPGVDLKGGSIEVTQSLQYVIGRGLLFTQPKSARSRRRVAISDETIAELTRHRHQQIEQRLGLGPAYEDQGLVFAGPTGNPIPPYNISRDFGALVRAAGVGPLRFHDLRHTHATLLLRAGIHPKIVSERLGHSGVAITLDTYSHVTPDLQAEAASVVDRFLLGGQGV